MRLTVECEHGEDDEHWLPGMDPNPLPLDVSDWPSIPEIGARSCFNARTVTDPDAILEALVEAGWLESERHRIRGVVEERFVSPWKGAK